MLTWLLIALIATICLVLLCRYVVKYPLAAWDRYFAQHSTGNSLFWQVVARFSDPLLMVLYAFILAAFLWWQGRWSKIIWVLATLGVADSLGILLKRVIHRSRPAAVRAHYSFPSGHVLGATVMALLMLSLFRQRWIQVLVVIGWLLICLSRLLLKAHYLSDVLAAICLATCIFSLSMNVIILWSV